tara:strand:- start:442 stop:594 length:153 start_codon:yes stop_codon:yes gene_type:complete
MSHILFGTLLSTTAQTVPIVGIAFIALFVMVEQDYNGINTPSLGNKKDSK